MNFDVVIVGAGPIGCYTAKLIAEKGYSVMIVEEHSEIGYPVQCAGLVSERVIKIADAKKTVLNKLRGAVIHSPNNQGLVISDEEPRAYAIDRCYFDKTLAESALDANAALLLDAKALSAKRKNKKLVLTISKNSERKDINCNILIGADGAQSSIARWFELSKPKEIISGFGAEIVSDEYIDRNFVEIYLGSEVAKGFFAWLIPTDETVRVGLCAERNPYYYFKRLLKFLNIKKIISYNAGIIPIGVCAKTYSDNIMVVGDAACHVKPMSGGGLYTGLISAKHCAETAVKALEKNDFSSKIMQGYQNMWFREIGNELKTGLLCRKIFKNFTDNNLDFLLAALNHDRALKVISRYGDLDYQSKVIKALLLRVPKLLLK